MCAAIILAVLTAMMPALGAQSTGQSQGSSEVPESRYTSTPPANAIERLNARLDAGTARLSFQGRGGYLQSAVDAAGLSPDSQMLVFSDASFQARHISEVNPRAIFFTDDIALGWVRDGDVIEVAAQDPSLGTVFYTLEQKKVAAPRFKRAMVCLGCHLTAGTLNVPGLIMFTSTPGAGRRFGAVSYMNHSTPMENRFGGWFVTGALLPPAHVGNAVSALEGRSQSLTSTAGLYKDDGFLARTSDIAALLVFAHQAQTINLLIRAVWEARTGAPGQRLPGAETPSAATLRTVARDVVDSLLFVDEARFDAPIRGSSGFTERFETAGPQDSKGRSLRQLDLTTRLLRYPCSYLIYSSTFDALPELMKKLVYERLWAVLSGAENGPRYRRALTLTDRRAIVEILRATKPSLPSYFTRAVN